MSFSSSKMLPVSKKPRLDDTVTVSDDMMMEVTEEETAGGSRSQSQSHTDFQKRILALAKQFPKGIPNKIIQGDSPNIKNEDRAAAINNLLEKGILDLYKQGNELLYKLKTPTSEPAQMKGADEEERVVYDIVASAGNKGIWIRDIRFKSNLSMPQLNKILKVLETKRIIKTVKSVAAAKKKVYMLFELEPDRSLSGGAFHSDQDFEVEFVQVLHQQCLRFLQAKRDTAKFKREEVGPLESRLMAMATLEEIWQFIKNLGISKVELSQSDIESILNTLVRDDKIEQIVEGEKKSYFSRPSFGNILGIDSFPCGVCPVARQCSDDGPINPRSCVYMTNWLNNDPYAF